MFFHVHPLSLLILISGEESSCCGSTLSWRQLCRVGQASGRRCPEVEWANLSWPKRPQLCRRIRKLTPWSNISGTFGCRRPGAAPCSPGRSLVCFTSCINSGGKELEASRCQEASAVKAIGGERTLWMNSILPRSAEMLLGTRSY